MEYGELFLIAVTAMYFTPTIVAFNNKTMTFDNRFGVFFGNLVFGWTLIGWIIMYMMASANLNKNK